MIDVDYENVLDERNGRLIKKVPYYIPRSLPIVIRKNTSRENALAYQKAVFEALEDLATTHGKEKDYYTKLFQQYQQLEYATSMMYPQFVQNFGYALGTVDHQDYKQNTYHEVVTGTKQK